MLTHPPKIIALCGHPRHGKSTVQGYLEELGVLSMDDGLPIRQEGMRRYGLTWEQVSTQAGKLELFTPHDYGREMEVREALGLIGKEKEDEDAGYWAERALENLQATGTGQAVSFGSVRRTQGHSYRKRGGIVLEVFDPRKPKSPYDFDQYDISAVTHVIINNEDLNHLRGAVHRLVEDYLASSEIGSW